MTTNSTITVYKPDDLEKLCFNFPNIYCRKNKGVYYLNVPFAYDIETTSFYEDDEERAVMYAFVVGIAGNCIVGRTWDEFEHIIDRLHNIYDTDLKHRIIIYVHNLSYEMQFIRKRFTWYNIFATEERKPIYAVTNTGIEFRCSYMLTGKTLAKVGVDLQKYKVSKMVGDLDYKLLRHCETPLTDKEIGYIINDGRVVMALIQECIEASGNIGKIPLTKTGYVREYIRNSCLYRDPGEDKRSTAKFQNYRRYMKNTTLTTEEYELAKEAFQGGFTHCSCWYSDKTLNDVGSYDFTSSYPAVMVSEQFPMSRGELVKITSNSELRENLKYYCCIFEIEIINIKSKLTFEHPIASSKCWLCENGKLDNGRIVSADKIRMTITDLDFKTYYEFYSWDKIRIGKFYRYKRGYLPTPFIKALLKLYQDKTELKGVSGRETDYLLSKELINSAYGMCVTDIARDTIKYENGEWKREKADIDGEIEKYNNNKRRFLSYLWGVYVTAYARRNLFIGIKNFGDDYVYSDTDSIKALNCDNHIDFIELYNSVVVDKMDTAMDYHKLPHELTRPKTIKGVVKQLGVWDYEGLYTRFRSVGAKRYMTETDGDLSITVSGVNKKMAVPFLLAEYDDPFEHFDDGLIIPAEYTGKPLHTYIDYETRGIMTDYLGNENEYHELSAVHLSECEYTMNMSLAYIDFLKGIRETER